ncbi:MAG: TrkA C-terminal domain-containing protein [Sedimentisphaerales bacterium]|nr:TrkA C-terminal domain-containing protein [Sedimentisphaerales bacterium]
MNLALFLVVLFVSFIIVRIGAIAFQLTGLEWSMAKFQALSCFTSTGFTTREAEHITSNPQRRRIASTLMVLGHAGLVTMIATLANTLRAQEVIEEGLSKPILPIDLPPYIVQLINLLIIIAGVYLIYKFFTNTIIARKLTDILRQRVIRRHKLKPISIEELSVATGGYGVATVRVPENHRILEKLLSESGLRKEDINVLAIVRKNETIANPEAGRKIHKGDELICFGKLENIRKEFT